MRSLSLSVGLLCLVAVTDGSEPQGVSFHGMYSLGQRCGLGFSLLPSAPTLHKATTRFCGSQVGNVVCKLSSSDRHEEPLLGASLHPVTKQQASDKDGSVAWSKRVAVGLKSLTLGVAALSLVLVVDDTRFNIGNQDRVLPEVSLSSNLPNPVSDPPAEEEVLWADASGPESAQDWDKLTQKLRASGRRVGKSDPKEEARKAALSDAETTLRGREKTPGYGTKRTPEMEERDRNKMLVYEAWDTIHRGGHGYPGWYDPNGGLYVNPERFNGWERREWVKSPASTASKESAQDTIRAMVDNLRDPYSTYLTKSEAEEEARPPGAAVSSIYNRLVGVGLQLIDPVDGREDLVVVAPVPESPAEIANIKPLDRILSIGEVETQKLHLTPDEAMSIIRGRENSDVVLTIRRARNPQGLVEAAADALGDRLPRLQGVWSESLSANAADMTEDSSIERVVLRRKALNIPPVRVGVIDTQLVAESGQKQKTKKTEIGYIRINYFNRDGTKELAEAIKKLENRGVSGYVIDVRNCLGGMFKEALLTASMFMEDAPNDKDTILVNVMDASGFIKPQKLRNQKDLSRWASTEGKPLLHSVPSSKPIRILTNRGSASSSEVLAMSLAGNGRAKIIGERTFGKALIQHPYKLADGSVLKITVAEYLSPRGEHLGRGLEPWTLCTESPAPDATDPCVRLAQVLSTFSQSNLSLRDRQVLSVQRLLQLKRRPSQEGIVGEHNSRAAGQQATKWTYRPGKTDSLRRLILAQDKKQSEA